MALPNSKQPYFCQNLALETNTVLLIVLILLVVFVLIAIVLRQPLSKMKDGKITPSADGYSSQLQLQAYERLVLLVDRIALPNVISRLNQAGVSAKELQQIMVRNIKEEFEYNISQQIYVSADSWNAVKNLKEQNLLVINQLGNALPATATGMDLNKFLLEYLMNDKKGSLHEVVSEVLSFEAKKIMR